jgi:predicted esterase YcpF (UPF0227 family)
MKLIYFHGKRKSIESDHVSQTALLIQQHFPEVTMVHPVYDTDRCDVAISQLDQVVHEALMSSERVVLVGSSLGGFFAKHYGEKNDLDYLLINPCLDPWFRLAKYETADLESFKDYRHKMIWDYSQNSVNNKNSRKYVVLGKQDDIIPYTEFVDAFVENCYTIFINKDMAHRVSDIKEISQAVSCLINSYT